MKQHKKQAGITVFYSYAAADGQWRNQLAVHLSQLKRDGLIEELYDHLILPGEELSPERDRMLRSAQTILLLITADFLASDACYQDEMQQALERHRRGEAHVVPILVRPCDWQHSPFAHLQYLPRNGQPITTWSNSDEAFLSIAQELRKIIAKQQFPPPPLSSLEQQNRTRLLKRVRATWIKGLLKPALHRAAWIDLHLQEQPDVLKNPWRLQVPELDQTSRALPVGTSIVEVYDEADGELLIMGEPGAGKTMLLLELTRTLLERAEEDERLPMPIVFHLSSWAEKRPSLSLWLIEELETKYDVPHKIGQEWIDTDQVLPLLDGLDEVAENARTACVQQINDYYRSRLERGSCPIVVCCRSEEYTVLSTRVMLQQAISILPLTSEQINTYLEQAGEQVKGLKQALNEDAELHSLARQPLMLNIFTLAYQGATPAEVPTGETREGARHTVFATYVGRMLKHRGLPKHWKPEKMIRWLTFLAKQTRQHNHIIFYLEQLQLDWLSDKWALCAYHWLAIRLPGIIMGMLVYLAISLCDELSYPGGEELLIGWFLLGGLLGGLLSGESASQCSPDNGNKIKSNFWLRLLLQLVVSAFIGGSIVKISQLDHPLRVSQNLGICLGLGTFLLQILLGNKNRAQSPRPTREAAWQRFVVGVRERMTQKLTNSLDRSPLLRTIITKTIRFVRSLAVRNGLLAGFLLWLSYVLVYVLNEMNYGLSYALTAGLRYGLGTALSYALSYGLSGGVLSVLLIEVGTRIKPTDRLAWSWRYPKKGLFSKPHVNRSLQVAGLIGLFQGVNLWLSTGVWATGLSNGLSFGLSFGLSYWFLFGLFQNVSKETIDDHLRNKPNQGIRYSGLNGCIVGFSCMIPVGLSYVQSVGLSYLLNVLIISLEYRPGYGLSDELSYGINFLLGDGLSDLLHNGLLVGVSTGLLVGLLYGWLAFLRHYVLRLLLKRSGSIPWNYARFLNEAMDCILLRKVGGGYTFIHRLLLDDIADHPARLQMSEGKQMTTNENSVKAGGD